MTQPENNKKPKAITLAEWLETSPNTRDKQAAAELRRLRAQRDELLEALQEVSEVFDVSWREGSTQRRLGDLARAAIAKATD